jgi:hypothetical protein
MSFSVPESASDLASRKPTPRNGLSLLHGDSATKTDSAVGSMLPPCSFGASPGVCRNRSNSNSSPRLSAESAGRLSARIPFLGFLRVIPILSCSSAPL